MAGSCGPTSATRSSTPGSPRSLLIPHDCCSGQCDTCKVRVLSGSVDDQGTLDGAMVLACQATIEGDAEIVFEEVPIPARRAGTLPYGHAFYRPGPSRLVLVASGTGWAPIWSVARAARLAEPTRAMVVIAAARDPRNLYMGGRPSGRRSALPMPTASATSSSIRSSTISEML